MAIAPSRPSWGDLAVPTRPGRPCPLDLGDLDRPGWPDSASTVALDDPGTRSLKILGQLLGRFLSFFEVASREQLDLQGVGPNLCFCWQARYFGEFAGLTKSPKIDEGWRHIAPTSLRKRAAREQLNRFAPGRDSASILVASACSRAVPGTPSGVPGRSWGLSGLSQDAPETLQDSPEMLPRRLQDALGRHGASREGPGSNFGSILGAPQASPSIHFRSICDRANQRWRLD